MTDVQHKALLSLSQDYSSISGQSSQQCTQKTLKRQAGSSNYYQGDNREDGTRVEDYFFNIKRNNE